jgi:thioesterase domain-containing protein
VAVDLTPGQPEWAAMHPVDRDGALLHLQRARHRRAMAQAAMDSLDLVLPLRVGGAGHPLFCAHPVGGLSWCYLALLPHLDARHAVYGLQSRGVRRPEPLPATMPEAARDFADRIRATQPTGPYHLLGWSLGGNLAFAIAEELERRGHEVGLLAFLDAAPHAGFSMDPSDAGAWELYNFVLTEFGYNQVLRAGDAEPEARVLATVRARRGAGMDDWPDRRILALLRVVRNNVAITRGHRPGRVRCPLLLVSASRDKPPLPEKIDWWRPYVGGPISAIEVDCRHSQLLLPESAAHVGRALEKLIC